MNPTNFISTSIKEAENLDNTIDTAMGAICTLANYVADAGGSMSEKNMRRLLDVGSVLALHVQTIIRLNEELQRVRGDTHVVN